MNKKFLSVILFSALMVGSIGTFTACKDYDDDINDLNGRVDAVEKGLAELKSEFSALAYVKDVAFADGKLTVTKQDGTKSVFDIPDENTNTTYTIDVVQSGVNNNTVTITMTGSDGSTIEKTITFTDTNTGSKFDPTKLILDKTTGKISYDGVETGVTLPAEHKAAVVTYKDNGVVIGWEVDGTKLLITDVLPITSFEYIPENILAGWGERVIVFTKNEYKPVVITADVVTPGTVTKYLPNEAIAQYQVNPSSATLAQLEENGKAAILHKTVNLVTKAATAEPVIWKKSTIEKGVMSVALEADPSLFVTAADKLDEIALQFGTVAGNNITTEYVGVINKPSVLDLRLTDKEVIAIDAKDADCHFALSKVVAVAQKATIGTDNKATLDTHHLVQQVTYSKAIAGINLEELVHACNTATGHVFFDYPKYANFKLTFEVVAYNVNETPQEKYISLEGSTFKAVNYGGVNESSIGKAPMVLAKLTDTHNNALIAAAYIKLLIVGDAAAPAEGDITINNPAVIGLGCNAPALHSWATNDEFMSTKVYTFSSNNNLTALSKEQFHTIYTFVANPTKYTNKGNWAVEETIDNTDGKSNHKVTFTLKDKPLVVGEYYAYGTYQKTTDLATLAKVDGSNKYPNYLAIKYTVKVDAVNFTATAKEKIGNYWEGNNLDIYCNTPGDAAGAQIDQDLNTNFMGGKVAFDYNNFDAVKYPSFAKENMSYKFIFSAQNLDRTVSGVDGKLYQLYLSDDKANLYAELSSVAVPVKDALHLVASLSGDNNNDITYAKTAIAKNLLNIAKRGAANAFFAVMNIRYANGCDQTVEVANGEFNARFLRPVNVVSNPAKQFEDGNNEGACVLNLNELISFTDWRDDVNLNSFTKNLSYYKFYNVTKIALDVNKNVMTDLGKTDGSFVTIEEVFGAEGARTLLTFNSLTAAPDGTTLPNYGTVTYKNKDAVVKKEFKLQIPLVITYAWGDIKETVTVVVTKTL